MFVQIRGKLHLDRSLQKKKTININTSKNLQKFTNVHRCPNCNMHFGSVIQNPPRSGWKNKLKNEKENTSES